MIFPRLQLKPSWRSLSLYHRCLCVLLAYTMLLCPSHLQQLARGAIDYGTLTTGDWHAGQRIVEYGRWDGTVGTSNFIEGYDQNGSVLEKLTWDTQGTSDRSDDILQEQITYKYNLQNRLIRVVTDSDPASGTNNVDVVDYRYNPSGMRVQTYTFTVAQNYLGTADEQTHAANTVTTDYLIDSYNPTGYAQVVERWKSGDMNPTTYLIGDDVIGQKMPSPKRIFHLHDGLGSTRQVVQYGEVVEAAYAYDAYGVMLGGNPTAAAPAAADLLYAGEHFDTHSQHYYNRARWYDSLTGRFNRAYRKISHLCLTTRAFTIS